MKSLCLRGSGTVIVCYSFVIQGMERASNCAICSSASASEARRICGRKRETYVLPTGVVPAAAPHRMASNQSARPLSLRPTLPRVTCRAAPFRIWTESFDRGAFSIATDLHAARPRSPSTRGPYRAVSDVEEHCRCGGCRSGRTRTLDAGSWSLPLCGSVLSINLQLGPTPQAPATVSTGFTSVHIAYSRDELVAFRFFLPCCHITVLPEPQSWHLDDRVSIPFFAAQ